MEIVHDPGCLLTVVEEEIDGYLHRKYLLGDMVMKVEVNLGGVWMTPLEALQLAKHE